MRELFDGKVLYRGAWLHRRGARQWCNYMATGFRLPEGVHYAALAVANEIVKPEPSFGVDRFADRAEDLEHASVFVKRTFLSFLLSIDG